MAYHPAFFGNDSVFRLSLIHIFDEIFSPQYQAVLFAPEAKTRQWLYKKEVQNETVKKYYLEYMEYNSAQIEKVAEFLSE